MQYRKLNMGTMNMELWCPIFTGVRNAHCAHERKTDDDWRVETKEKRREWNEFLFNLPWLRGSDVILVTPPFHLLLVIYLGNWIRPKFEFGHMWPSPYKTEEKKNEFCLVHGNIGELLLFFRNDLMKEMVNRIVIFFLYTTRLSFQIGKSCWLLRIKAQCW